MDKFLDTSTKPFFLGINENLDASEFSNFKLTILQFNFMILFYHISK